MVKVGDRVVGQTSMGFWIRATVQKTRADGSAQVRFGDFEAPSWLARTQGFGAEVEWLGPERMAPLPSRAPTEPPPAGAEVIALWDGKRFHLGRVSAVEGTGKKARVDVRFDYGETLPFTVREVLPVLPAAPEALRALEAKGLEAGLKVRAVDGEGRSKHPGWIARLGTGKVYVRYPQASHGHWLKPDEVKRGGGAKPRRPPKSSGELATGARVIARWTDGQLYPGMVGEVRRRRWGREAQIHWDDGSVRWTPEARVWVTEAAGEPVPQRKRQEPADVVRISPGQPVAALAKDGTWRRGRVALRCGGDVFVAFEAIPTKRGDKQRTWPPRWARGRELALPPDEDDREFPAPRAHVLAVKRRKQRHGVPDLTFEAGRAKSALGDRLEVALDGGVSQRCVFEDVWVRDVAAPTEADFEEDDAVRVLLEPDIRVDAVVLRRGRKKREDLWQIRTEGGETEWVDAARLERAPEPPPPPPTPPPPEPEPEPVAPPDPRRALLLGLLTRWTGPTGYRDARLGSLLDDDERGARLPVDVGLLSVRLETSRIVDLTAATGDDQEPTSPPTPAMVRLASWVKGLFAGPVDPEEGRRLDEAWAKAQFVDAQLIDAQVERAGDALTVRIRCGREPTPAELVAWARAVHERLFDRDDEG